MKKNNPLRELFYRSLKKTLKIMRVATFLLILGIMQAYAVDTYSQKTKLSLNFTDTELSMVLDKIEVETEFFFLYNEKLLDTERKVSIDAKDLLISMILDNLFTGTDVKYTIIDRKIILAPENLGLSNLQQQVVTGTVTDSQTGDPLPGVNVVIKGTTIGTLTDINGNYSLSMPDRNVTLVFSFIGYSSQEIPLGGRAILNVSLVSETVGLEEVVVVGYGTQKKISLTGSVVSVESEDITIAPVSNVTNTLAGRLPGLISLQSSGRPGNDKASISIRGFGNPLVIVDGIEADFNNIDPNQIESVSMLKDGSAAIYGSRASNGVLLITTKRGTTKSPEITLNSSYTFQTITAFPRMTSSGQRAEMEREGYIQSGQPEARAPWTLEQIQKFYDGTDPQYPNTDWYHLLIRDYAPQSNHNLSVRGGSEKIKYYGFLGYLDQEAIWKHGKGEKYIRYNVQSNVDMQITSQLSLSVDLQTTIESREYPYRSDERGIWNDFWDTSPMYHSDLPAPYEDKVSYAQGGGTGGAHITTNSKLSGYNNRDNQSIRGTINMNYVFDKIKGLSAKAFFNYNKGYNLNKQLARTVPYYTYDYGAGQLNLVGTWNALSRLEQYFNQSRIITGQLSLRYEKTIRENHHLNALILYEGIDEGYYNFGGGRQKLISDKIEQLFSGDVSTSAINGSASEGGRVSYVSRINYDYKSKYFLEGIFRADASAKFPPEGRWGYFPGISAGWRLSEEAFIKSKFSNIDNLKLRLSYGQSGNDAVANFAYLSAYKSGVPVVLNLNQQNGMISTGIANPTLSWEEITLYNVGLDFSMYKNKLFAEMDVFYRKRDGIPATRVDVLPNTFGSPLPPENINSMDDRGFELVLGSAGSTDKNLKYNIKGNVSWSRTKWIHYEEPEYTDPDQKRIQTRSGTWTDVRFGYVSDGLFTSQEEINALGFDQDLKGNTTLRMGDIKYVDTNKDGILDWKDQVKIGQGTVPHWFFGFNIDLNYKNFDCTSLIQGAFGYYNDVELWSNLGIKSATVYDLRWTEKNNDRNAFIPRLGGASTNSLFSDFYFRKAGYVRLKTMSVGYNLPESALRKTGIKKVRIYAAGTNLLTYNRLRKYELDPEAPSHSTYIYGLSTGKYYPQQRTISLGINITL